MKQLSIFLFHLTFCSPWILKCVENSQQEHDKYINMDIIRRKPVFADVTKKNPKKTLLSRWSQSEAWLSVYSRLLVVMPSKQWTTKADTQVDLRLYWHVTQQVFVQCDTHYI